MFAERLKKTREKLGMTQLEAAKMIDIAPSSYSAYEVGKQNPKIDVLVRMCEKFHVSADWLLGVENSASEMNNREILVTLMGLRKSGAQIRALNLSFKDGGGISGTVVSRKTVIALIDGEFLKPAWDSLETLEYNVETGKLSSDSLDTWLKAELEDLSRLPKSENTVFSKYLADAIENRLKKEAIEAKRPIFD